jgi:hypothetical protein
MEVRIFEAFMEMMFQVEVFWGVRSLAAWICYKEEVTGLSRRGNVLTLD